MRRTATVDTELGGAHIAAGDKVVMWYLSANHDERIFDGPGRFDITRSNAGKHLGFGAKDIHHCLGMNLARLELRVMLEELFTPIPHFTRWANRNCCSPRSSAASLHFQSRQVADGALRRATSTAE
jgi:cytochrome P450